MTRNLNHWMVTDKALEKALMSLIGFPLLAYPDHNGIVRVGQFVGASKPNGYAVGTAEISDPASWEKVRNGEWKLYARDSGESALSPLATILNLYSPKA